MQSRRAAELTGQATPDPMIAGKRVVEEVLVGKSVREALSEAHTVSLAPGATAASQYRGYQALVSRTVDVSGDELTASRWLSLPCSDLRGEVPLRIAGKLNYDKAAMDQLFEPIFVRIEHGIYY